MEYKTFNPWRTVRLKTKLSIFQNKPEQNLKCYVFFFLMTLCCFELENSVNSGTLLSESITSF